eukprot:TRINITY_DN10158_c0_g1_i1.p1 TRINITY_DN10158_c0_g1~~TRINITY_DN10158_c0_g1_i1.p1  ORF type:complete len:239 (+),score=76.36 TRINITY_DN10158_c0_g1_i1:258-974(+)
MKSIEEQVKDLFNAVAELQVQNKELKSALAAEVMARKGLEEEVRKVREELTASKTGSGKLVRRLSEEAIKPRLCDCRDGWDACIRFKCAEKDVEEWKRRKGSPLHVAVDKGRKELLQHLCDCHDVKDWVNRASADSDGRTPLHEAANKGQEDHIRILISKGAFVNTMDTRGLTPLWLASYEGHLNTVKVLLEAGADAELANKKGKRPADVACTLRNKHNRDALEALFVKYLKGAAMKA